MQTIIPSYTNNHNYSFGLDNVLKAQQLSDCMKANPNVKIYVGIESGKFKQAILKYIK